MHVAVVLYEGFDQLDAVGPYEVFHHAATHGADVDATVRTVDGTESVVASSHDLRVEIDGPLTGGDLPEPDLVVVPGGGWNSGADAGARAAYERGTIPDAVADLHDDGATVAAVCTGGMLLAGAGLLDGRPAVTHAGALDDLRATDAEVVAARVVDDGDVLTAGGVTSGIDLALHVVEREFGSEVAEAVATTMEYERRGVVWTADEDDGGAGGDGVDLEGDGVEVDGEGLDVDGGAGDDLDSVPEVE